MCFSTGNNASKSSVSHFNTGHLPTFVSARMQSILGKSLLVVLSLISQVSSTFSTSICHRLGFEEENILTFPVLSFFTTTLRQAKVTARLGQCPN